MRRVDGQAGGIAEAVAPGPPVDELSRHAGRSPLSQRAERNAAFNQPVVRTALHVGIYLLVLVVGYLDWVTGPEIGFSLFYVVPIMLAGWYYYEQRVTVIVLPFLCAVVWLAADILSAHQYSSPWIGYWNSFIRLGMFFIIGETLSRLRQAHAKEQVLARIDPLTGACNARYFAELVSLEISRAARFAEPFSFAYIDLDNFKSVNDTFGHDGGDALLKTLVSAIRGRIRDIDVIARLGGDEFGLLFPEAEADAAGTIMQKVEALVRESVAPRWGVTFSAGVITFRTPPATMDEMVRKADALMYAAKRSGKDQAAFEVVC